MTNAYIYQAEIYCEDCATSVQLTLRIAYAEDDGDSSHYPQGPYPNGGGEADSPQHCGSCGLFLENPLTDDGLTYIRQAVHGRVGLSTAHQTLRAQWAAFYNYL